MSTIVRVKFNKGYSLTFYKLIKFSFSKDKLYEVFDCGSHWLFDASYATSEPEAFLIKIPSHCAEIVHNRDGLISYPEESPLYDNILDEASTLFIRLYSDSKIIHEQQLKRNMIDDHKLMVVITFLVTESCNITKANVETYSGNITVPIELGTTNLMKDTQATLNIPAPSLLESLENVKVYIPSFQWIMP